MDLVDLILIALGLVVAAFVYSLIADHNRHTQMRQMIAALPDFRCAHSRIGTGARDAVAIDEGNGTICLLTRTAAGISTRLVPARNILGADVYENRISRTVQSGRGVAVMVGRFAVPVSRPRLTMHNRVNRVEVRTTVNDPAMPLHSLTLLTTECADGGALHALASQDASVWRARIVAIAARAPRAAG